MQPVMKSIPLVPRLGTNLHGLSWPSTSNPYHYKAFRLKINRVGKYPTFLEFVKTPTFWRPHVDPAACTNFSTRTFERRPPETREIFLFPFLLSPFPPFSLYGFFPFFSFLSFFFAFLFFFSFLISFSFHFSSFSLLFLENQSFGQWVGNCLPISSN